MSRSSKVGINALGALLVAGLAAWILVQIGIYLLIGGALALLGWLGWTVMQRIHASKPHPQLVFAETPSLAPPPEEHYRVVLPVDVKVFDDKAQTEAAAMRVFAAWTRPLPLVPDHPEDLIRSLQLRTRRIGRLLSEVAEREGEWKEEPYSGTGATKDPALSLSDAIGSSTAVEEIRKTSRHVATCTHCRGDGKTVCGNCGGTTHGVCPECQGAGKAYGIAKNGSRRLMNCKSCHGGKDSVHCPRCADGTVRCANCTGSGRVERWIELKEKIRYDIQVEPDGEVTRAFRWGKDGTAAPRTEVEEDAKIVTELTAEGVLSHDALTGKVPSDWIAAHWKDIQPKLQDRETVRRQSLWLLEVPSIELSYGVTGKNPTVISLEGRRMLAPPSSLDRQLAPRAERIQRLRYVLFGLGVAIPLGYLTRGGYYWNIWLAGLLLCLALLGVAIDGFNRDVTIGSPRARKWAMPLAVIAILACGVAFTIEPSAWAAKRYIASGRFQEAELELKALDPHEDGPHRLLWADLRLARLLQSQDIQDAARDIGLLPTPSPQRAAADRHLFELTRNTVEGALAAKQPELADDALRQVSQTLQSSSDGKTYQSQLGELYARVAELRFGNCGQDLCRLQQAQTILEAAPTPARQQQLEGVKAKVLESLEFQERTDEPRLERLRRLRQLRGQAALIEKESGDESLAKKAQQVFRWTQAQRAIVALLGADRETIAELLESSTLGPGDAPSSQLAHVAAYTSLRGGRCTGLYLVGDEKGARTLNDTAHMRATEILLSQAFGRAVPLPEPPGSSSGRPPRTSRRLEAGVPIVARWSDGSALIELRIGDATP